MKGEGYFYSKWQQKNPSDIKILKGKLSQLENKLLAVAEINQKEEENNEILETLRKELKMAEKRKPRQWVD